MPRSTLTNPARRIPHTSLHSADGGREVPIIWRRTAPILLFLHAEGCAQCRDYAASVAAEIVDLQEWDGRPLIVLATPPAAEDASPADIRIPVLHDAENRLADKLGVAAPAVVIGDQWGEIYESHSAGEGHDFITPAELVSWARTIATKCPECEGESF